MTQARPASIRGINALSEEDKLAIYSELLPDWLFVEYDIDPDTHLFEGHQVVHFRCPAGSRAVEITIRRRASDLDPLLYLHMADTFNNQLLVLLVVVNNPDAPRFHTDRDLNSNPTNFGTQSRNIPAELAAMKAGLAPGQVRQGLRAFKRSVPIFESFVECMGHDLFLIEPLAYHNSIVFERYGFTYMRGKQEMERIHQEFQPDGEIYQQLSDDNPFRTLDSWESIRGRSWAIHDGILGHPFTGFQMYKRLGIEAGVNTFPNARW